MRERRLISIENTRFIWSTNFSGDPKRDNFGSTTRKGNIIISDPDQAQELMDSGFNVKMTKPREGDEEDFIPTYFVSVIANYDTAYPPRIYLVSDDSEPRLLDEESIGIIDTVRVRNINVVLNPYNNQRTGRNSLYVRTMYVEQDLDEDPFASRYRRKENARYAEYEG